MSGLLQAARSDSYALLNRDTVQEAEEGQEWGSLIAAARLGERASIGNGFWVAAHGGAVSLLQRSNFLFYLNYFTHIFTLSYVHLLRAILSLDHHHFSLYFIILLALHNLQIRSQTQGQRTDT